MRSLPLKEIENHEMVAADQKWMQNNLGFLTDAHQVNVAITRAKYGLIIIGKYIHMHLQIYMQPSLVHYRKCNIVEV